MTGNIVYKFFFCRRQPTGRYTRLVVTRWNYATEFVGLILVGVFDFFAFFVFFSKFIEIHSTYSGPSMEDPLMVGTSY